MGRRGKGGGGRERGHPRLHPRRRRAPSLNATFSGPARPLVPCHPRPAPVPAAGPHSLCTLRPEALAQLPLSLSPLPSRPSGAAPLSPDAPTRGKARGGPPPAGNRSAPHAQRPSPRPCRLSPSLLRAQGLHPRHQGTSPLRSFPRRPPPFTFLPSPAPPPLEGEAPPLPFPVAGLHSLHTSRPEELALPLSLLRAAPSARRSKGGGEGRGGGGTRTCCGPAPS